MKADYVPSVHMTRGGDQIDSKACPPSARHVAFDAALKGAISNQAKSAGTLKLHSLADSKPQQRESLESSYRVFAQSFGPRRDPPGRPPSVEINAHMLRDAENDPAYAWQAVEQCVYDSFAGPLLDITDPDNIRYSATGESVTAESVAYYAKTAAMVKKELADLYQHEKNIGTPPAVILKQLFCCLETQPRRFLEMSAW